MKNNSNLRLREKNNNSIIFARVSKRIQKPDRQIHDLSSFADEKKYNIKKIFIEYGSGTLNIDERPVLMEMLNYVILHKIKYVLITEASRLSRNISEVKKIISLFRTYRVNIYIQNIDIYTSNEFNYSLLEQSVRMANYEVKLMQNRLSSGLEEYKRNGGIVGRKKGYKKDDCLVKSQNKDIIHFLENGYSIRKIMNLTNKSSGLVQKVKKILEKELE